MKSDALHQSNAVEAGPLLPGVRSDSWRKQKSEDGYKDDSSYNWRAKDSFVWDAQDLPGVDTKDSVARNDVRLKSLMPDRADPEETVPVKTLKLAKDPKSTDEEDRGVDPYNTGQFETS